MLHSSPEGKSIGIGAIPIASPRESTQRPRAWGSATPLLRTVLCSCSRSKDGLKEAQPVSYDVPIVQQVDKFLYRTNLTRRRNSREQEIYIGNVVERKARCNFCTICDATVLKVVKTSLFYKEAECINCTSSTSRSLWWVEWRRLGCFVMCSYSLFINSFS